MDIEEFFEEQQNEVAQYINRHFTPVSADQLGLDKRAGYNLHVNDEAVVVSVKHVMALDYYGGFEYVSSSARFESCGFVFFTREDARVVDCIFHWKTAKVVDNELEVA